MQDCHGALGIVCRLATAPRTPEWDPLLLHVGALTWRVGPLSKGASLCHGTAGTGFAMLKLWRRSGEGVGLDHARALAMHGCVQVERHGVSYGQGRQSMWTGDLGSACLLWTCIARRRCLPYALSQRGSCFDELLRAMSRAPSTLRATATICGRQKTTRVVANGEMWPPRRWPKERRSQ